ncbi:MAG: Cation transporter-like protein MgtE2 [Candidatus Methanohalarchaeum thermophilum]|uniref:Cation transporter-like protein MgtE2 n=1 Tax=Methanohalarchaeum thermophilum TaxID=1903181 RepID=A0A1Q6DU86_METT1|nr:MAG: Cation transporter-like protein MgtE2 [Candidatus Methanohalarchaeum thermophilum]
MELYHWEFNKIVRESLPLLIGLTILGIASGLILQYFKKILLDLPELLVLVPVIIGLGGNLGSILGSRITSGLHLGYINFSLQNKTLLLNITAIYILSVLIFSLLGITGSIFSEIFNIGGNISLDIFILISLISGFLITTVMILITIISSYITYKTTIDPDSTVLPIVTSLCDLIGISIFYYVVEIFF